MNVFAYVKKLTGYLQFKRGYVLGTFPGSFIAGNLIPDVLVRWEYYYNNFKMGAIQRERAADLQLTGGWPAKPEAGLDPANLVALREGASPVVIPPDPDDPPPVDPDPDEPPEEPPMTAIKMTIEQRAGNPTIVGDWFEPNIEVTLISPKGQIVNRTQTGAKGTEFGSNSYEAGYNNAHGDGNYISIIGSDRFVVPVVGAKRFIRLYFERTDTPPAVVLVRLVSKPFGNRVDAEDMLLVLDVDSETRGMFKIEAVK